MLYEVITKIISDKSGEIIEDYSAFELNTNAGESFICEKELNGWLYGFIDMKESIKGWIPKETVDIKDNMITKIEPSDVSELLDFIVKYKTENKRNITPGIIENIHVITSYSIHYTKLYDPLLKHLRI